MAPDREARPPEPDVDAIRARWAAATAGPWFCWDGWGPIAEGYYKGLHATRRIGPDIFGSGITPNMNADLYGKQADLEFAASAWSDVASLLAENERLRAALRWAMRAVVVPRHRTKANAGYCDEYDAALRALRSPSTEDPNV
jgi:hypothetical protein